MCVSLCSHVEKITTWQDPRKTMAASMNQMSLHAQATSNNGGVQARSMALSQPNLGEEHTHSSCSLSGISLFPQRLNKIKYHLKVYMYQYIFVWDQLRCDMKMFLKCFITSAFHCYNQAFKYQHQLLSYLQLNFYNNHMNSVKLSALLD